MVRDGKDPKAERDDAKLNRQTASGKAKTVREVWDKYFDDQIKGLVEHTRLNVTLWANKYILPLIGEWPIQKVTRLTILDNLFTNEKGETCGLRVLWKEKNQTARQVQNHLDRMFRAAISEGVFVGDNPAKWKGGLDQIFGRRNARRINTTRPCHTSACRKSCIRFEQ
jgi:hypothetical protein